MSQTLIVFASLMAIYLPILISPGPNFLVVTQTAVNQSRRHAVFTALGVSSASVVMAGFAATGLGLLMERLHWFQAAVQMLGGAYLMYMGANIWRHAARPMVEGITTGTRSLHYAYWYGLASNLSNPKALVFFVTIFTSIIPSESSAWLRLTGVLGVAVASTAWHLALANWFSGVRMQRAYRHAKPAINRFTSCVLLALGLHLLWQFFARFNNAF